MIPLQASYKIITKCECSTFTCPGASDFSMITKDRPKKRSVVDELDELDEIAAAQPRRRRAINLHEIGSLADVVKHKRAKLRK